MKRSFFVGLLCCALGAVIASGEVAQAEGLPQIQAREGSGNLRALTVGTAAYRWRAVGRLDTGASFCSATLIRDNLLLTAAHCVFHPTTFRPFDAAEFTYRAGLRNGHAEAIRTVRRVMVLPDYRPEQGPDMGMIGLDLALLELDMPISLASIPPISPAQTAWRNDRVTIVSYGRDREDYASIEEGCEILQRQGSVRSMSCEVVPGASGSPVLRVSQGRVEVVAVVSASGQSDRGDISLAVALDDHLATLMAQFRGAVARPLGEVTSFVDRTSSTRGGIGARFIRP